MVMLRQQNRAFDRGFTLIEIMIVVAIMGIMLTAGIPVINRAFNRDELGKAVNDIIEGCKAARDRAILQGIPFEFIVKESGELAVEPARDNDSSQPPSAQPIATRSASRAAEWIGADFPRQFGEHVAIELIDVNFIDHMGVDEARVRFYPNGTSDEFTVVMATAKEGQRQITLDVVTGLADEVVR
jgi:prepilin-type N-terminal cleavage/methylation domain-containing protein